MSAIDQELRELATQTISVLPATSRNKYGALSTSTAVVHPARVVEGPIQIQDSLGNIISTQGGHAWVFGSPTIGPEDQIELPSGSLARLEKIERFPDDEGFEHVKLTFSVVRRR